MTSALTSSLLTAGCKDIPKKTGVIGDLIKELLAVEVKMQDAHIAAKQDPDKGEAVLQLYVTFLERRDALVAQLQKEGIAVPWKLRIKIDEFEQSLKERKRTAANTSASLFSTPTDESTPTSREEDSEHPLAISETSSYITGVLPFVASVLVLGVAVYLAVSHANLDLLQ
ncbi:hypothetical protein H310_08753 [Aphanomyces invadans]|uniref:Uncharacterized protein n=1 Tax=Aphanomyces invadans TaxID=157072 RepID=A0A024TYC4_9STRA|nr:hypothetical protein H310_08753 [Aphanomyces invadans]ETV98636.1 hypothetical protein H310_08753 [Aphanomyces invadans]|eukprot:XP_008872833.1 hypothetical protein H310_08753 [Aphanomyces invadans]